MILSFFFVDIITGASSAAIPSSSGSRLMVVLLLQVIERTSKKKKLKFKILLMGKIKRSSPQGISICIFPHSLLFRFAGEVPIKCDTELYANNHSYP
ncbi:hypothetical protein JB92DRAFT_405752 [Gautieria morchelliformis]|nr:hypothetical protein JB92DRAFT_405752 [Gautieria morchelliformis]